MNIAEILKNVPKGTKLYSPVLGDVTFKGINNIYIEVLDLSNIVREFYHDGRFYMNGECMLFPSRENRDWNTFYICPFKKGDFIVREYQDGNKFIAIFSHFGGPHEYTTNYLCLLRPSGKFNPKSDFGIGNIQEARLATDEEKKDLLDAITRNGYYWDECSMTLKKLTLKFKVGDTIYKKKKRHLSHTIISIEEDRYIMKNGFLLMFTDQHEWELAKFDINSLKIFDRVLVRDYNYEHWNAGFYSQYIKEDNYPFKCVGCQYKQCIPYNDGTKHLVGTKEDCPEYYKTW